jgi:hypothetical protein
MPDLTMPAVAADYIAAGATPDQAAILAEQHEAYAGRRGPDARAAIAVGSRNESLPPNAAPHVSQVSQVSQVSPAEAALNADNHAQLQGELDHLYQPPASPYDYRVPVGSGDRTDEAFAADKVFTTMLHTERVPRFLGEAIMQDIQAARPHEKTGAADPALRGWIDQMLKRAQADPALRPYVAGVSPDLLLQVLSPATVTSLTPFVHYRASRR